MNIDTKDKFYTDKHQKTTLSDGFNVTVVGKPTIAPQVVISLIYHKILKLDRLIMFRRFMGFFSNKPNQNQCNNTQKSGYLSLSNLCSEINHIPSKTPSVKTASLQNIIAATILKINTKRSLVANIAKNQAATKLEQIEENTFNWALVIVNINSTLAGIKYAVNKSL